MLIVECKNDTFMLDTFVLYKNFSFRQPLSILVPALKYLILQGIGVLILFFLKKEHLKYVYSVFRWRISTITELRRKNLKGFEHLSAV